MNPFSRRTFLRSAPAVAAAVSIPAARASAAQSAQERFEYHLAEMKKAAEELDPMIGRWHELGKPSDETNCVFMISAFRVTGHYQGDGVYERSQENWNGTISKHNVKLLDYREGGERVFLVSTEGEQIRLPESRLNTFIGKLVKRGTSA